MSNIEISPQDGNCLPCHAGFSSLTSTACELPCPTDSEHKTYLRRYILYISVINLVQAITAQCLRRIRIIGHFPPVTQSSSSNSEKTKLSTRAWQKNNLCTNATTVVVYNHIDISHIPPENNNRTAI